jgi:predicted metal-dependent HD superfamily phosphohydrolase
MQNRIITTTSRLQAARAGGHRVDPAMLAKALGATEFAPAPSSGGILPGHPNAVQASGLTEQIMADLRTRHGEAARHYHTWAHITALLSEFVRIRNGLHDSEAMVYAILFHDSVYDPAMHSGQNEAASASVLLEALEGRVQPARLQRAHRLVMATATHTVPDVMDAKEAADCATFLDMDMAILGADPVDYDAYAAAIAREYTPSSGEEAYRRGRTAFLQGTLARPRLFATEDFHLRLDAKARSNMQRELTGLQQED